MQGRVTSVIVVALLSCIKLGVAATCTEEATALRTHLMEEARHARRWNTAWALAFGAAAVGQLALAVTETKPLGEFDDDFEATLYVGASKATVGVLARVVTPLRIDVPAATSGDACVDLVALRAALGVAAKRERRSFWVTHLGGTALNFAGAAVLASRRSLRVGAISFVISYPVGPLSAYSQPRRSWKLWRKLQPTWSIGVTTGDAATTAWVGGQW